MNIFFAIICVFGATATIMLVSTLDLGGLLKAAIVIPMVLLAVYSMARIPPKEPEAEKKNTGKSRVAEIFEKAHISDVPQKK